MSRRRWAVLLVCVAAGGIATFALIQTTSMSNPRPSAVGTTGAVGPTGYQFSVAQPIPGVEVSMRDARKALGGPIVLPDSSELTRSDVGAVWMNQQTENETGETDTAVAVTFPSQRLVIEYGRPAIDIQPQFVKGIGKSSTGFHAILLNGVPAVGIPQEPHSSHPASIEFVAGGTTVTLIGYTSEAFLQAIAQSILDRTTTAS